MSFEPPLPGPTTLGPPLGEEVRASTQILTETDGRTGETATVESTPSPPSTHLSSTLTSTTTLSSSATSSSTSSSRSSSSSDSSSRTSSSRISSFFSSSTSRPTSTPTSGVASLSSSGNKPSLALPILLALLGLAVVAGLGVWCFCFRRRTRPGTRRRASGVGGWKGIGTREIYRDDPAPVEEEVGSRGGDDVEMRAAGVAEGSGETGSSPSSSTSRGRPRDRSSLDTISSDPYLLSDISHISTFNPILEVPRTSHSSHGTSRPSHNSSQPPTSPESPTPPSRSVSFSFLRKSASPLAGLVTSLFPSGYRPPSLRTVVSSSNEADDGISGASTSKRSTPTQRTFSTGMESSVGLLEEGEEEMVEEEGGEDPSPKLSEVRKGKREISTERSRPENESWAVRQEGIRGEIHDVV